MRQREQVSTRLARVTRRWQVGGMGSCRTRYGYWGLCKLAFVMSPCSLCLSGCACACQSRGLGRPTKHAYSTAQHGNPACARSPLMPAPPSRPSVLPLARSLPHPAAAGGAGDGVRGQPQGAAPATQQHLGVGGVGVGRSQRLPAAVAMQQGKKNWAGSRQPTWGMRRGGMAGGVVRCARQRWYGGWGLGPPLGAW